MGFTKCPAASVGSICVKGLCVTFELNEIKISVVKKGSYSYKKQQTVNLILNFWEK